VEAAYYPKITSKYVANFIINNIICQFGVPHKLISDEGCRFKKELAKEVV